MKNQVLNLILICTLVLFTTSCYVNTQTVGKGPQSNVEVKKANHYFIFGLAAGSVADVKQLSNNATDYEVTIKHTFVDGLLAAITFGIYTPTTTIVKK